LDGSASSSTPTLLTLHEAAGVLRLAESHVRAMVREGRLPVVRFCTRPGSRLYFDLGDLRAFIESCKRGAA